MDKNISKDEIDGLYDKLFELNKKRGYFLNPDESFTKGLIESLLVNGKKYGYQACPCRLASGNRAEDLDIICPCDYRDADIAQYGVCYCGLYVSKKVYENNETIKPIPERRPHKSEGNILKNSKLL